MAVRGGEQLRRLLSPTRAPLRKTSRNALCVFHPACWMLRMRGNVPQRSTSSDHKSLTAYLHLVLRRTDAVLLFERYIITLLQRLI